MAYVLSSVSGNLISAASAGYAPTNSGDVSAIASAYQVVSATATQLYAGTAYVTSVNDNPLSASRAGNAANASLATSAYYDGTGRLISSLPDSAAVSAIASSYAESAASSKQDTLTFGYNTADQISSIDGSALGGMDEAAVSAIASAYAESAASSKQDALTFGYDDDKISSINGSSLAGEGGGLVTALGTGQDPWYQTSISSINGMNLSAQWADSADNAHAADIATSATYAETADFAMTVAPWVVSAYISAVTSRSGTIIVTNRTGIDATDSAVVGEYVPGYSGISTYAGNLVPFNGVGSAVFTGIPDSLPVTASLAMMYGAPDTVTFSGSNGTTASASYAGSPTALTADLGKVSSVYVYTQNQYIQQYGLTYTADAVDNASIVALAHASALPTYQYDAEDKISAINGSAIGGAAGIDSATCSAIASAYAESAASGKQDALTFGYDTASAISSIDGSALAGGGGEADWSAESGQPGYIENKPVPKTLVAGAGITITENSTELVVASTNTLYTAGSGLTLNGTTFAVDTAVVQGKITYGYDASGNISGIDGSSLAGSDPEAADLYVQSPLYTGVSGGSAYIGWSGYNETVLWSSTATASSFTLSESISSFERLKVQGSFNAIDYWTDGDISNSTLFTFASMTYAQNPADGARLQQVGAAYTSTDGLTFTCRDGHNLYWTNSANSVGGGATAARPGLYKVIGVNRIAGE